MKVFKSLTAVVVGCVCCATVAMAEDGPHDKAIKARQAMFQLYSYSMGVLGGMAKGKTDYNAELAVEMAKNLDAAANLGQSTFWPPGSDNSNSDNARTRALAAIWETYPEVNSKGEAFKKATAVLAANAGSGLEQLQSSIGDVGKACKGCHDDFRAKKK